MEHSGFTGGAFATMKSLPRISIVTPCLNQARYIEKTVRSILAQGYPDLDYLVVDGGSTDGTIDILKKFEPRLRWISEADRGQSHAINKGFSLTTGEVCGFLNADDLYEPGALERVGKFFSDHPDREWLAGRCRIIGSNDREIRRPVTAYKNFWLGIGSFAVLNVLNYVSQPAAFWRRRVMEKTGPFAEDLYYGMDYDFWLRIGRQHRLGTIPQTLAGFRVHSNSKTGTTATRQFDELWSIVRRRCHSPALLTLHRLHRSLETVLYRWMLERERWRRGQEPEGEGG